MGRFIHKILYRLLSLEGYLRVVSRLFFWTQRLGIGRYNPATEYVYHLEKLVKKGDTAIDIGANLGYYSRTLSRLVGPHGRLYAVEPVPVILNVLRHNLSSCRNVEILPYALGEEQTTIRMANDTPATNGYFGTGQNHVAKTTAAGSVEFTAEMRRGSELFADLDRLDFIKCDIEGYEWIVMSEMRNVLKRFHPTVLIETGGENRPKIIHFFEILGYEGFMLDHGEEVALDADTEKDIIFRYKE